MLLFFPKEQAESFPDHVIKMQIAILKRKLFEGRDLQVPL
jgi:hypothetical protein